MSTLRAHIAMLRTLAKQDPQTTMLMMSMLAVMEEMAEELERLAGQQRPDPPERGLGSI